MKINFHTQTWFVLQILRKGAKFAGFGKARLLMKYVKQFLIILGICLLGELLKYCIPLPVPASIYGLLILFIGLMTGIIQLEMVKETAKFLIDIMPIMFVPAGVGLLESWGILQNMLIPAVVITIVSTVVVMVVSGRVTQFMLRRKKGEETDE